MHDTTHHQQAQELAQRTGAGLEVTLSWSPQDDCVTVKVVDLFAEECFEMAVSHDRASYAYHHPFAYAAEQGLDHEGLARPAA